MTINNTSSRPGRMVRFDRNTFVMEVLDLKTSELLSISRTSYWDLGDPPGPGHLLDVIYQDGRVIGARQYTGKSRGYEAGIEMCPQQEHIVTGPVLFMAGPVQGAADWQATAMKRLRRDSANDHLSIVSQRGFHPLDADSISDAAYETRMLWEARLMNRAADFGVLLFWFARESEPGCREAYAQSAQAAQWDLVEWKERFDRAKPPLVVGVEPGFLGGRELRLRLRLSHPTLVVYQSLESTVLVAEKYVRERWPRI